MTRATMSLAPPAREGDDDADRLVGIGGPRRPGERGGAGGAGAEEVAAASRGVMVVPWRAAEGRGVTQLPRHRRRRRGERVDGLPVARDVDPARDPDLLVRLHVVEEARSAPIRPGLPSRRQCMPIDIIFGRSRPAGSPSRVERVEGVAQVGEEVLAGVEALRLHEAHVVGVERVGHDEVRRASCRRSCRPRSRTAGRRRSSRCRTRSRRARRRGGACSGCRGRCTSRAARRRRSAPSARCVAMSRWRRSAASGRFW